MGSLDCERLYGRYLMQSDLGCRRLLSCIIMSDNSPSQQKSSQQGREIPLDERFYDLTNEDRAFFKQQTGIQDDEELKTHILQVQAEAYKVCRLDVATAKH
jgi:hypothetical protein